MAQWFLTRMASACANPAPLMYVVYENGIRRVDNK